LGCAMPYSLDFEDKWHQNMGATQKVTTNPSKTFALLESVSKFNNLRVHSLREFGEADETQEPPPIEYGLPEKQPKKRNEFKNPSCFGNGPPRFANEERFTVKNGLPRLVLRELRTKPTEYMCSYNKQNPDMSTVFGQSRPRVTSSKSAAFRGCVNTGRGVTPFITSKTFHLPTKSLPKGRGWPVQEELSLDDW
jgi:hypothetical protein